MLRTIKKLFYHGRAWQLRTFLILLIVGSGLFLLVNLVELKIDYHQARSWQGLWEMEWRAGLSTGGLWRAVELR